MKEQLFEKMIFFYNGNVHYIAHFMKVHSYASLIGKLENLDEKTQNILEMAAIVHDISCPLCREKYGNDGGGYQQIESEALLRPFLAEYALPADVLERIIYLVSHHHTVTNVVGLDYQILLEADFLVNAAEEHMPRERIVDFYNKVVRTEAGKRLFESIYLR